MKKTIVACLLLSAVALNAQSKKIKAPLTKTVSTAQNKSATLPPSTLYSFSTFTANYQNITGTVVSGGLKWDDPNFQIPIGFNFQLYNGIPNDTINFFGGEAVTFNDPNSDPYITAAFPMFEDLCDRAFDPNTDNEGDAGGISDLSYTTTGTPGARICKIEVKNAGFFGENEANSTSASFVNYQIWLYETTNDVEFRFGSVSIQNHTLNLTNGTAGFVCGMFDSLDVNGTAYVATASNMLNGPHNAPSMVALNPNLTDVISGNIQSGRVYRFAKSIPTSIKSQASSLAGVSLFPNPAGDVLNIKLVDQKEVVVDFFDVSGKLIYSETTNGKVSTSSLPNGFYIVKVKSPGSSELLTSRVIISH